jgi:hypothetical protein
LLASRFGKKKIMQYQRTGARATRANRRKAIWVAILFHVGLFALLGWATGADLGSWIDLDWLQDLFSSAGEESAPA